VLAVPVLPGTAFRGATVPPPASGRARLLVGAAVAVLATAAVAVVAVVVFSHGSGKPAASPAVSAPVAIPATTTTAVPAPSRPGPTPVPSPAARARAAAVKLAARLPVALESAALLRSGSSVYVVGGSERGKPADGVWRIDLATRRVSSAGRFIEPLAEAASARRGGVLYLAGGWTGEKVATAVLRWTPGAGSSLVARLPTPVRGARAPFAGGRLVVAGGGAKPAFTVDVDAGTVQAAPSVPAALRARSAAPNLALLARALLAETS
jgi:hypothetical protein